MSSTPNNNGTLVWTIGGTLLSVLSNIHAEDLVKTCVLAIIGAIVSFVVSVTLKFFVRRLKRD